MIFMLRVLGRSETKTIRFGRYAEPRPDITARASTSVVSAREVSPEAGTTAQMMAEPLIGSGTATAAVSLTSPVARSRASISAGPVRLPAILIVSSERP